MSGEITIIPPDNRAVAVPEQAADISGAVSDSDLVRLWLSDSKSPHTVRLYERIAFRFLNTLPHGLKGATLADIARFDASIAHLKPLSIHTMRNVVKSLYAFAQRTGYVAKSPAHVRRNRKPAHNSRNRYLTDEEVWRVIDHAVGNRDQAILKFLYGTAVRISELLGLIWSDISETEKGQQAQILGKGGRYRTVAIPAWVGLVRPDGARSDDAVFTASTEAEHPWPPMSESNIRRIMRDAALLAGLQKKVSPHWFRHAACSNAEEKGVSIVDCRDWLGHKTLTTTSGYLHSRSHVSPGDVLERKK
jgi:integrase/recombinase XerD